MPESPLYADFTMASRTDRFFHWVTSEQMPTEAAGHVDSPTGWFCLVRPEREDVIAFNQEEGDPWITGLGNLPIGRWYLVQIDGDGLIWAHSYEGLDGLRPEPGQRRRALADFSRLTRIYDGWCDPLHQMTADWKVIRNLSDAIGECVDNAVQALTDEYGLGIGGLDEQYIEHLTERVHSLATTGKDLD